MAAANAGEIAVGYRCAAQRGSAEDRFGVQLSPPKATELVPTTGDRLIVLAEGERRSSATARATTVERAD